MRKRICIVAAVALGAVLAVPWLFGGGLDPVTQARLESARARWEHSGVTDYELVVEIFGAESGQYDITVRGGRLEQINRNGEPANPAQGEYWTVDGLFRTIEAELHFKDQRTTAQPVPAGSRIFLLGKFDVRLGYPRKFVRQITGTSRGIEIQVQLTQRR